MARPELPGAAVHHSVARSSISVGGSHPLFQPPAKNALLFFVWLWYIGLGIVKAALKSSIFLFFLEQLCYFNLSPQGDGNRIDWMRCLLLLTFQLIPARGRKLFNRYRNFELVLIFQLIPARGRKPCCSSLLVLLCYCNLSPQGGKKLRIKNGAEFFFCVP